MTHVTLAKYPVILHEFLCLYSCWILRFKCQPFSVLPLDNPQTLQAFPLLLYPSRNLACAMGFKLFFLGILAISTTITHAHPAREPGATFDLVAPIVTPTPANPSPTSPEQRTSSTPKAASSKAPKDDDDGYLTRGPPTAVSPAQARVSKELAAIAAAGSSLNAAGKSSSAAFATATANCNDGTWALSTANYNTFQTDQNLRAWWDGGKDTDGITYPPGAQAFRHTAVYIILDINNFSSQIGTECEIDLPTGFNGGAGGLGFRLHARIQCL